MAGLALLTVGYQNGETSLALLGAMIILPALVLASAVWFHDRSKLSESSRRISSEVDQEYRRQTMYMELDLGTTSALFLFGVILETIPFLLTGWIVWGILPISLPLVSFLIQRSLRESIHGQPVPTAFFFLCIAFAVPFSFLAAASPNSLANVGLMSAETSREISLLFFLYVQGCLIYCGSLLLSFSWRVQLLRKATLSLNGLADLQEYVMPRLANHPNFLQLKAALLDIPFSRQSFIEGNYSLTTSLSWSVIDRALEAQTGIRDDVKAAEKLGLATREFIDCYSIRNKVVHDGYKPTYTDALAFLGQIRLLLEFLNREPDDAMASVKR